MKRIVLQRVSGSETATYGVMIYKWTPFCVTLELPWLGNASKKSCIAPGKYLCTKGQSPSRSYEVWWLQGVDDREAVQIHILNYATQTEGCIGVGEMFEPMDKKDAIQASGKAFSELNSIMGADKEFMLEIRHYQL